MQKRTICLRQGEVRYSQTGIMSHLIAICLLSRVIIVCTIQAATSELSLLVYVRAARRRPNKRAERTESKGEARARRTDVT